MKPSKLLTAGSAMLLLGLSACGGGKTGSTPTSSPTPTRPGTAIVSISSPVAHGGNATLSATAAPSVSCTLAYTTPAGTHSTAGGLGTKNTDSAGKVSWTWKIGSNTNPGTGTVLVSCGGQSASGKIVIT